MQDDSGDICISLPTVASFTTCPLISFFSSPFLFSTLPTSSLFPFLSFNLSSCLLFSFHLLPPLSFPQSLGRYSCLTIYIVILKPQAIQNAESLLQPTDCSLSQLENRKVTQKKLVLMDILASTVLSL